MAGIEPASLDLESLLYQLSYTAINDAALYVAEIYFAALVGLSGDVSLQQPSYAYVWS